MLLVKRLKRGLQSTGTNDQKKSGRQVISSQITKDSASTRSALGFVRTLRVGRRGRPVKDRPRLSEMIANNRNSKVPRNSKIQKYCAELF